MSFENDRYSGTTADLNLRKQEENQPSDEMIEMITKAEKWARCISYGALVGIIFLVILLLPIIIFAFKSPSIFIGILPLGGALYVTWLIFTITKQYANLARDLDSSDDAAEDIASCFELHTRFIKLVAIFTILLFVIGFVAAIAIPAPQR